MLLYLGYLQVLCCPNKWCKGMEEDLEWSLVRVYKFSGDLRQD